jgi:hypothetical protein
MMMEEIVQPQQQPNDFERDHCYCVLLRAIASIHTFFFVCRVELCIIEGDSLVFAKWNFSLIFARIHTHKIEIFLKYIIYWEFY